MLSTTRNYSMALRKKYIHLLFVIGLFLHSSSIMSAQFGYEIDYNSVSAPTIKEVTEVSRDIPTIFRDNPMYIIAPTAVLLGGGAFLNRKSIQGFCKIKYESLAKDIANTKMQLDNRIDHSVPIIVRNSAKKIFTWALGPITTTAQDYWKHNELHVYAATFCGFIGWISSHTIIGGGLGGVALALGYLNQGYKMLEELKTQAKKNFEALQTDIKNLSKKIDGVKQSLKKTIKIAVNISQKSIETKVEAVGVGIHSKIDQSNQKFEIQLSGLSKEIQVLTDVCVSLTGKFDKLHKDNAMRDEKSDLLFKQLTQASMDLLSAKESFSSLSDTLMIQMTTFTEKTEKQLHNFTSNATEQLASMQSKVETQAQNTAGIKDEVSQLLGKVSESHELITALQKAQIEGNQKIIGLSLLVEEKSLKNSLQSQLIEKFANQQEQSTLKFTESLSSLEVSQNKLQTSFDGFFQKFERMQLELKQLKEEQEKAKQEFQELTNMFSKSKDEFSKELLSLRQHFDQSFSNAAQEVKKDNERTRREISSEIRSGFAARPPQIAMHDSSTQSVPLVWTQDLPRKSDFCLPWSSSRPQLFAPQVFAGVLGVALNQRAKCISDK